MLTNELEYGTDNRDTGETEIRHHGHTLSISPAALFENMLENCFDRNDQSYEDDKHTKKRLDTIWTLWGLLKEKIEDAVDTSKP